MNRNTPKPILVYGSIPGYPAKRRFNICIKCYRVIFGKQLGSIYCKECGIEKRYNDRPGYKQARKK